MAKRKPQQHYCDVADATIAEQQARLDAISLEIQCAIVCEPDLRRRIHVLATGKPRRECVRLTKKYGKKEARRGR